MIKVFLSIAALAAIAAGFAWLVDHPGSVTFTWQSMQVETTLLVAAIAVAAFMVVVAFIWTIIRTIWRSPQILSGYFSSRRRDKGYAALSTGLVAVGEGDPKRAHKAAMDASRLLENAPLALLLKAQSAQLSGEHEEARKTFHAMLEEPETKLLGLRGLFMEAERSNEPKVALQLAMMAMEEATRHPKRPGNESTVASWAGPAVLRYQSGMEDWDGALRTVSANQAAGLIDRTEAKRKRAVVLVAKALELEDGEPQEAKAAVLEAHKLAPELIPAAVVGGRILSRLGELRRAVKTIESTWKHQPHPDLAETYAHIRPGDAPRERVKRIKTLIRNNGEELESAIALAKVAIDAQDWTTARAALRPHLNAPTQRACLLMADIEEGEHGDKGRVREWLAKAVHAAADPVWIADGVVSDHWAPVSPHSGQLDAYEWRIPQSALSREPVTLADSDVLLAPLAVEDHTTEDIAEDTSASPMKTVSTIADEASNSGLDKDASEAAIVSSEVSSTDREPKVDEPSESAASDPVQNETDSQAAPISDGNVNGAETPIAEAEATDDEDDPAKPSFVTPEQQSPVPDDPGPQEDLEEEKRFKLF